MATRPSLVRGLHGTLHNTSFWVCWVWVNEKESCACVHVPTRRSRRDRERVVNRPVNRPVHQAQHRRSCTFKHGLAHHPPRSTLDMPAPLSTCAFMCACVRVCVCACGRVGVWACGRTKHVPTVQHVLWLHIEIAVNCFA
jgi:hypothetical protein